MDEDETPFAHIPEPTHRPYEPPSAIGPVGQIAFYGNLSDGLRRRSPIVRIGVVLFVLVFLVGPSIALVVWLARS